MSGYRWIRGWLLVAILLACASRPGSTEPPSPQTARRCIQVGAQVVAYAIPESWTGGARPNLHEWFGRGEGRLIVMDQGPDPRRVYADRLADALKSFDSRPGRAVSDILAIRERPRAEHETDGEPLAGVYARIKAGCDAVRKEDVPGGKALLEKALADLRALETGDNVEKRARYHIDNRNRRGAHLAVRSVERVDISGHPAVRAVMGLHTGGNTTGLYVLVGPSLLSCELFMPQGPPEGGTPRIMELARSLEFDVHEAPLAVQAPGPVARVTPPPAREREPDREWSRTARKFAPVGILLLFTSVPAFLGASLGFAAGRYGGDAPKSAAGGAFWATFLGVCAGCLIVVVLLFTLLSQAKSGSGIMSPTMGGIIITCIIAVVGGFSALCAGALAALGAWVGSTWGRTAAGIGAALLAAPGALIFRLLSGAG